MVFIAFACSNVMSLDGVDMVSSSVMSLDKVIFLVVGPLSLDGVILALGSCWAFSLDGIVLANGKKSLGASGTNF